MRRETDEFIIIISFFKIADLVFVTSNTNQQTAIDGCAQPKGVPVGPNFVQVPPIWKDGGVNKNV